MKTIITSLITMLLLVSVATAQKVEIPEYQRKTLDNGLVVLLMESHKLPLIQWRMTVRGGSSYETPGTEGVANLVADLLTKGTAKRTATQIAAEIDFVGGSLDASASNDFIFVSCQVMRKDLTTGLSLFSDVILNPQFTQEEVDRERKQALANLDDLKDNPSAIASLYFTKLIYQGHPYGHQSAGTKNSLSTMTPQSIRAFYKDVFIPNTSVLTVVGDFESKDMLNLLKQAFGDWKKKSPKSIKSVDMRPQDKVRVAIVNKPDLTQTQIRIGNTGVSRNTPDYFQLRVANSVLGDGFTSRLIEEIRVKRSLTYGVRSGFSMGLMGGAFQISSFTKNSTVKELIEVAVGELKKLRDGEISETELTKAKNYVSGNYARSLQSIGALASNITEIELYGLSKDYPQNFIPNIKKISLGDVKKAVAKYFPVEKYLVVAVGKQDEIQSSLESLGPVEAIDFQMAVE